MKKEFEINGYAAFGVLALLLIPALVAWQIFWTGITIHYMWDWFVFPLFGIAAPSIVMCAGLASFAGLLTKDFDPEAKRDKKFLDTLLSPVFRCVVMLGIWWVVIKIVM